MDFHRIQELFERAGWTCDFGMRIYYTPLTDAEKINTVKKFLSDLETDITEIRSVLTANEKREQSI